MGELPGEQCKDVILIPMTCFGDDREIRRERTAVGLARLGIVLVPVRRVWVIESTTRGITAVDDARWRKIVEGLARALEHFAVIVRFLVPHLELSRQLFHLGLGVNDVLEVAEGNPVHRVASRADLSVDFIAPPDAATNTSEPHDPGVAAGSK